MKLLIVDTETTGLSEDSEVCEMAATLYSVNPKGAIASLSTLLPIAKNAAQLINGISPELSALGNRNPDGFNRLAIRSNYAVAFNAEFDGNYWEVNLPWICAMKDFDWGYHKERFTLVELALWLGIGIGTAHRAGDDVRLLVECFNRCPDFETRLEEAIVRSQSPTLELKAIVSYDNRNLAKEAGFNWDANQKLWLKKVRECDYERFVLSINFDTHIFHNGDRNFVVFQESSKND
ncbi:MAG: 3'-5' exonuclease [Oscillatoriales cyanobacterium]|uniref:hypothetical protein n=1 Tax=unclassified Microcoleus TaxID=2642155 RepID=UPI001D7BD217|nr:MULTISPECIES: hypothetical protein [unclassified Microcoleus]TAF00891.1 MAG: 3'-5' exonuclease [Oscillatoriales cyanobacterium]MCC3459767.1 3'-5' exonuclease [Microcoleus sp. PH2017_11_PCY_U_A]MCC3478200.1 3'-5' exonuclease [Microcoleus sp. PH2017_12_PCY_D_A]TAF21351.1 MAG: 3'-5' exonuclease [Oscillatoriales cyanobacterium]TAF39722.1 MAG: 3'-5' exonuclease [Oscillatoriales cyanobacterium]